MERDNGAAYLGIGLITGVVIGLGVGILFAPQPGAETRAMIKDKASEIKDKAAGLAENVKMKAGEMLHKTEEMRGCG